MSSESDLLGLYDNNDTETKGVDRREELLGIVQRDREQFLSPEDDRGTDSGNSSNGDELPPNFAFPVTKKIIDFLGTFSTPVDQNTIVNGDDSPSTKPPKSFAYRDLLTKLRNPAASDILIVIRSFVLKFNSEGVDNSNMGRNTIWDEDTMPGENNARAKQLHEFLEKLEGQVRSHRLWQGCSSEEWASTAEDLEKFVMCKIEKTAFQPTSYDIARDQELRYQIAKYSFLKLGDLFVKLEGLEETSLDAWVTAGKALCKINEFKSPRDKLICILNCCRHITNILSSYSEDPGADEFLPALIYVILKANPVNLHSNIEYIAAYRSPKRLVGEAAYFFTHVTCAVAFLQRMDLSLLSIDPETYHAGIAYCESMLEEDPNWIGGWFWEYPEFETSGRSTPIKVLPRNDQFQDFVTAANTLRDNLIETPKREEELKTVVPVFRNAGELEQWKCERFRFLNKSVEDLKVSEVGELMEEYRILANAVNSLLKSQQ